MQAATITPDLMMVAPMAPETTARDAGPVDRQSLRRALSIAFIVVGVAATAWILGQFGTLLVYGLPAPFIRRVPVLARAA